MKVYLGNFSVEDMEKRAGIKFPQKLKDYMEPRKQEEATYIKKGKWHCFDMPFELVCGDIEIATEIHSYLKEFSGKFKKLLKISINERNNNASNKRK